MPAKLPITAAKNVAEVYGLQQVILLAWDGSQTHVVTYGKTNEDCAMAAEGANFLKEKMKWPTFDDQPPLVKRLRARVKELEDQLKEREVA